MIQHSISRPGAAIRVTRNFHEHEQPPRTRGRVAFVAFRGNADSIPDYVGRSLRVIARSYRRTVSEYGTCLEAVPYYWVDGLGFERAGYRYCSHRTEPASRDPLIVVPHPNGTVGVNTFRLAARWVGPVYWVRHLDYISVPAGMHWESDKCKHVVSAELVRTRPSFVPVHNRRGPDTRALLLEACVRRGSEREGSRHEQ